MAYVVDDFGGGSSTKPKKTNTQALAAMAEENRRKKVQEYKNLINDVKKASSEISESNDELRATEKMIDKCITGEFANSLKSMIRNAQGQMEKVVNDLNVIGTKAAQNVEKEGEPCTYDKKQLNSEPSYNGNDKTTFSCNTDALRKLLPHLQAFNKNLEKTTSSTSNLPKLEGCEDVTNIPNQLKSISKLARNAYKAIESMIKRAEQAEAETEIMAEQLRRENIDAITGALRTKTTSAINSVIKKISESIEKALEKIETQGVVIWKDGVEYTIKVEEIDTGRIGVVRAFVMQPKDVDPNIPTVFLLDGDGPSVISGVASKKVINVIESQEGGESVYGKNGNQGGYKKLLLAGINYGGLTKPNVRFVYLPNNGNRWYSVETEVFDGIVENLAGKYDIDTDNMTLAGHSARWIISGRKCKRLKIYI